jgi:hypothetical protein
MLPDELTLTLTLKLGDTLISELLDVVRLWDSLGV